MLFPIILSALLLAFPAIAGDTIGGSADNAASDTVISVHQAEIRATAGAMTATGGYARIENTGHQDVILVRVDAGFATKSEIHTMIAEDGVMKMRRLEGGFVIPAHGEALLRPGGNHLMFIGLTGAMKPGSLQQIILHFDNGEMVSVMAAVKKPADIGTGHDHSDTSFDHSGTAHDHSGTNSDHSGTAHDHSGTSSDHSDASADARKMRSDS